LAEASSTDASGAAIFRPIEMTEVFIDGLTFLLRIFGRGSVEHAVGS
jgi:hypothetical protein